MLACKKRSQVSACFRFFCLWFFFPSLLSALYLLLTWSLSLGTGVCSFFIYPDFHYWDKKWWTEPFFFSFSFSCLEPGNHTYLLPTLISYSSHLRRKDKICKSYYDSWYGDFFSLFISTYIYIYIYNTKRRYSFAFDVSYSHHICQCNLIFILV